MKFVHRGYLADQNPFHLAHPPAWWLNGLLAFDNDLVVLPSRQRPVHWLGRRRKYSAGYEPTIEIGLATDAAMFRAHNLVDVTWVGSTEGWTSRFLLWVCDQLRQRDTWAFDGPLTERDQQRALRAGATRYTNYVDEQQAIEEQRITQQNHEMAWHASGEAWRLQQALTGRRVLSAGLPSHTTSAAQDAETILDLRDVEPSERSEAAAQGATVLRDVELSAQES